MISIDKVTQIFCIADDFCKEFDSELAKHSLKAQDGVNTAKEKVECLMQR